MVLLCYSLCLFLLNAVCCTSFKYFGVAPRVILASSLSKVTEGSGNKQWDVSPHRDGKIIKRLIAPGHGHVFPRRGDITKIWFNISLVDGRNIFSHEMNSSNNPMAFELFHHPSEVITGLDYAVASMYEGEIASFSIDSAYAYSVDGLPPLIKPDDDLVCTVKLMQIIPHPLHRLMVGVSNNEKEIGTNSYADVLAKDSALREISVSQTSSGGNLGSNQLNEFPSRNSLGKAASRFYDVAKHSVDPNMQVGGTAVGYTWRETNTWIDVHIPVDAALKADDLVVNIT
jgi:hypothetical protein